MVIIPPEVWSKMLDHCAAGLPNEACGLFAGMINDDGSKSCVEAYCLNNLDASPEHFSMAPDEQFAAVAHMRENGLTLLGNFHSHPNSPARPSQEDINLAFDPALSYVIISFAEKEPYGRSFSINKRLNEVSEEEFHCKSVGPDGN
ncbi:MAG: M67 family metallopeptidase [Treponema sp.]|jgi:proteasome lid subunit RPN8/RPN11|nr:M67 family metallopeptidase [Treponema sp.]